MWTPGKDAAPYISCPVVTRDRDSGIYNVGVYRTMVVDGRTVAHVHMFPARHPDVRKHLVFRDHLRAHPDAAHDYERLKRTLASQYRDDRRTYTDAKAEFIDMIIEAAISQPAVEGAERSSS